MDEDGTTSEWGDWFRGVSSDAVKAALGAYTYRSVIQPANGIPAVGKDGSVYYEGQRATTTPVSAALGGISTTTVVIALVAVVGLVLVLKD